MNIEELHSHCSTKKGVSEDFPFDKSVLVFKVMNKIFLLVNIDELELSFNVKCNPEMAVNLREKHPNTVFPGYHMSKVHWNTVYANREIGDQNLYKQIDHSYELVVSKLTKKEKALLENL
jgi:predicted DNA-binding protein (MmcQ/YjbR family)